MTHSDRVQSLSRIAVLAIAGILGVGGIAFGVDRTHGHGNVLVRGSAPSPLSHQLPSSVGHSEPDSSATSSKLSPEAGNPPCGSQLQFTISVPRTTYVVGQTVPLSGTLRNIGGACQDVSNRTSLCQRGVFVASTVTNQKIWEEGANPQNLGDLESCPPEITGGVEVRAGWTRTVTGYWSQNSCVDDPAALTGPATSSNPYCPNTQVPAGTYLLSDTAADSTTKPATIRIVGS